MAENDKIKAAEISLRLKILPVLFMCIILYPAFDHALRITKRKKTDQAKKVVYFPQRDSVKFDSFPKKLEEYYDDKFCLQDFLVTVNSYTKIKFLGVSPNPSKVIVGKNGWLFSGNYIDNYRGINLFTDKELVRLKKIIDSRGEWYAARKIKFYFAIPPGKPSIYGEFMPFHIQKVTPVTMYDQVVKLFKDDSLVNFIDLRKPLIEAKKHNLPLYFKIDHHWNDIGGFFSYLEIINRIQKDFPQITPLKFDEFSIDSTEKLTGGGEAEMLNFSNFYHEHLFKLIKKIPTKSQEGVKANCPVPEWFPYPWEYEIVRVLDEKKLPSAFIIRDSFTGHMIQYFQENFSKSKYLFDCWEFNANKDIIEKEKPDIVILMPLESLLKNILDKSDDNIQ